jgi:hypothetical protein
MLFRGICFGDTCGATASFLNLNGLRLGRAVSAFAAASSVANTLSDFGSITFPLSNIPDRAMNIFARAVLPANPWRLSLAFFPVTIVERSGVAGLKSE